jgi:hypothetical protein
MISVGRKKIVSMTPHEVSFVIQIHKTSEETIDMRLRSIKQSLSCLFEDSDMILDPCGCKETKSHRYTFCVFSIKKFESEDVQLSLTGLRADTNTEIFHTLFFKFKFSTIPSFLVEIFKCRRIIKIFTDYGGKKEIFETKCKKTGLSFQAYTSKTLCDTLVKCFKKSYVLKLENNSHHSSLSSTMVSSKSSLGSSNSFFEINLLKIMSILYNEKWDPQLTRTQLFKRNSRIVEVLTCFFITRILGLSSEKHILNQRAFCLTDFNVLQQCVSDLNFVTINI